MKIAKLQPNKQQGFVSIIVTMIIIVFVTLVAVGFAFLARQNQNQNLNAQLSTQAYYAAESGVNDAVHYLTLGSQNDTNLCNDPSSPTKNSASTATLDSGGPVQYTCVLVNKSPDFLGFAPISDQG